jgi:hypothetical protein
MQFDGPIPGENYTSDTRNYPWHRPPDIADYDQAIDYVIQQISEPEPMSAILTLLEAGASVAGVVSTINMSNIGDGKYPIDLSILIAGPIARYIELYAKGSGIEIDMGLPKDKIMTLTEAEALSGILSDTDAGSVEEDALTAPQELVQGASGGLMGMPTGEGAMTAPAGVQQSMLGYGNEEGMM